MNKKIGKVLLLWSLFYFAAGMNDGHGQTTITQNVSSEMIRGASISIGVMPGGAQGELGYNVQIVPQMLPELFISNKTTIAFLSSGYFLSLSPGVYLRGINGDYYGISGGYFTSNIEFYRDKGFLFSDGLSFFIGKEMEIMDPRKRIYFESGIRYFIPGYYYFCIGIKGNVSDRY